MHIASVLVSLALVLTTSVSMAETCATEDFELHISGKSQCLVMRRFGSIEPEVLVVWLHGDVSIGGPARYHFPAAQEVVQGLAPIKVLSVAMIRPGYSDGEGNTSTVAFLHSGRKDHYTKENLTEVGTAIERLQLHYRPKQTIVVGHSGGAATAAVLMGMMPKVIDGAVLVACPCDIGVWRLGRTPWSRSESPQQWVDKVDSASHVIAITGANDDNTPPLLAKAYIDALKQRGVAAEFQLLPNATHNSAFASGLVLDAVRKLVAKP